MPSETTSTRLEQVERALDAAVEGVFDEEFRELTARRFEETAYVLWKTGAEEDARSAVRVAAIFRERAGAENPVARSLLEVLVEPVLTQARAEPSPEGDDDGSPRVTP